MNMVHILKPRPPSTYYNWLRRLISEEDRLEAMVGLPGVWNQSRNFQIDFLVKNGLEKHHDVLDIGCGVLRGGMPLIKYLDSGKYVGVDVRPNVTKAALQQIDKHKLAHKQPTVAVSNTFGREELGKRKFDIVWAFQVLYHLDDDLLEECFKQVASTLKADSKFFANVNIDIQPSWWKEFPFHRKSLEFYGEASGRYDLNMERLGQLDGLGFTPDDPGHTSQMLLFTRK